MASFIEEIIARKNRVRTQREAERRTATTRENVQSASGRLADLLRTGPLPAERGNLPESLQVDFGGGGPSVGIPLAEGGMRQRRQVEQTPEQFKTETSRAVIDLIKAGEAPQGLIDIATAKPAKEPTPTIARVEGRIFKKLEEGKTLTKGEQRIIDFRSKKEGGKAGDFEAWVNPQNPKQIQSVRKGETPPQGFVKAATFNLKEAGGKTGAQSIKEKIRQDKLAKRIESARLKATTGIAKVDEAFKKAGALFSTGIPAQLSAFIESSPAGKLNSAVATIQAITGFAELAELKEKSETGGALGQVSTFELENLQQVIARIKPGMDRTTLKKNLLEIRERFVDLRANLNLGEAIVKNPALEERINAAKLATDREGARLFTPQQIWERLRDAGVL